MTTIYILTSEVDATLSTTVHGSLADAERCIRRNFDSEPADYDHLPLDGLIEALEGRDSVLLSIEPFELRSIGIPEIDLDQALLKQQTDALAAIIAQTDEDEDTTVTITAEQSDLLEGVYNLAVGLRQGN
jgi:hypothetical protein